MLQKILIALDQSDISLQALEMAIALALSTRAQLKLLHVLDNRDPSQPTFPDISGVQSYTELSAQLLNTYREEYQVFIDQSWEWLEWQANQATATGVDATYDQISGSPGPQICQYAQEWNADLIMIGSRCLTGLKELLLGSVSNYVVHHAPCSVQVVHPKPFHFQTSQPSHLPVQAKSP